MSFTSSVAVIDHEREHKRVNNKPRLIIGEGAREPLTGLVRSRQVEEVNAGCSKQPGFVDWQPVSGMAPTKRCYLAALES
jgi:hypothetical protein